MQGGQSCKRETQHDHQGPLLDICPSSEGSHPALRLPVCEYSGYLFYQNLLTGGQWPDAG